MRIMILDGGSIQNNTNHEENQSTYILDMEKGSPTSWIWSPRVIQGRILRVVSSKFGTIIIGLNGFLF